MDLVKSPGLRTFLIIWAGLMTAILLLLLWQERLAIWHLFAAEFLTGVFESFQGPAYSAATMMLVKPPELGRVNGLRSLADSASQVLAPMLAGVLLVWLGIEGVAGTLMSLSGYLWRSARRVEEDLPDYAPAAVEVEPAGQPVVT